MIHSSPVLLSQYSDVLPAGYPLYMHQPQSTAIHHLNHTQLEDCIQQYWRWNLSWTSDTRAVWCCRAFCRI
ncbi:hypothetical protein HYQ45_016507 [Verticillium longisporum]|uniref:Uncharacterized protein n=1 Tax=Verticillium longisporum TaxID=100787 RepID=A0A8I2Z7E3_VERLO|nr:hypothetical protein HYQ45_016507 [Verticillium longisporum]